MTNDKVFIYDGWNDEYIVRELTDEEQAAKDAADALTIEQEAQSKAEAEALRQTKISAYQKLGLTEAEIEALLPAPTA